MAKGQDGQRTVATYDDRDQADVEAARLVRAGIGATVDLHVPDDPAPAESVEDSEVDDGPKVNLWASLVPAEGAEGPGEAPPVGGDAPPADHLETADRGGEVVAEGGASPAEVRWDVRVLLADLPRACEELGLPVPEPEEKPRRELPAWAAVLIIWLIAMVTLPLLAFWITINVLD